MSVEKYTGAKNRLLTTLSPSYRAELIGCCSHVRLLFAHVLSEPGEQTRYVYFPTAGFISLVVALDDKSQLEVGIIGDEGMLGSSVMLGVHVSSQRAMVQASGSALRMNAGLFEQHCQKHLELRRKMGRYIDLTMSLLAQTAACTGYHPIEERLARWLLLSRDRVHGQEFHLTQEFLAYMLGVRRVGVTAAARALQDRGLISYSRGDIRILNNSGLERASCACYVQGNQMYAQTMRNVPRARSIPARTRRASVATRPS